MERQPGRPLAGRSVQDEAWQGWLRQSPRAVDLLAWWHDPGARLRQVGPEGYWAHGLGLLHAAQPRDCAAAGLGCSRRIDRSCRQPATCRQDPPASGGDLPAEGPTPGGCAGYYAELAGSTARVVFSADRRHRAVLWYLPGQPVQLWVDGVRFAAGVAIDSTGSWVGNRFFVVAAEGPDDHPGQHYGPGLLASRIVSVLVCDAEQGAQQLLHPLPGQEWTCPVVRLVGGTLALYPDLAARDAGRPDREIPVPPHAPDGTEPAAG